MLIKLSYLKSLSTEKMVWSILLTTKIIKSYTVVRLTSKMKYVENFNDAKSMSFLMEDEKLLLKHKEIWKIMKNNLKIKISDSDPVSNNKYLKNKISQ